MCRLRNIAQRDYRTDRHTDGQTDAGQSDPYVPLCFAGDTKTPHVKYIGNHIFFINCDLRQSHLRHTVFRTGHANC